MTTERKLPTQEEMEQTLAEFCTLYGAYRVTKALAEYARETSRQYLENGNDGAIIHKDADCLEWCLRAMKSSHPLRGLET